MNGKTRKIFVSAVALMLCLCSVLMYSACGDTGGTPDGSTAPGADSQGTPDGSTEPVTEARTDEFGRPWIEDGLPETADYDREFSVHTRGNVEQYEWKADEENGTTLNDAIYHRNMVVEEKYGIKLKIIAEGSWSDYASASLPKIRASVTAGNGAYDLLAGYEPITSLATEGLLFNLGDSKYINFEKPWWSDSFNEELSLNGINYFGLGALSLSMIYSMENIFVNTDILGEIASGYNIYNTVKKGDWNCEEVARLAKLGWIDRDNNGKANLGDRVGLAFPDSGNSAYGFLFATGIDFTTRDDAGMPTTSGLDLDKASSAIDTIIDLFYKTEGVADNTTETKINFGEGDCLFFFRWLYWGQTQYAGQLDHYGIVPMPKVLDGQENYYTPVQAGMHIYCIPIDVKSFDENSIITEALAAESYRSLMPKYFEVVLKSRYAKDMETSQMLDLMYETVGFDFCYIWRTSLNYMSSFKDVVVSKNNTLASSYNTVTKLVNKKLPDLLEKLMDPPKVG